MRTYLLLFYLVVLSNDTIKANEDLNNIDTIYSIFKITKIENYEKMYIIYAQSEDNSIFKIVSFVDNDLKKDYMHAKVKIDHWYCLKLTSIFDNKIAGFYFFPNIGDIWRVNGADITIEAPPVKSTLYNTLNLNGDYYIEKVSVCGNVSN